MRPRPRRQQPEKIEQAHVITLLRSIGAAVYTLGSRRASRCGKCGEYSTDMSTRQSPGIPDLYAMLPKSRRPGPDGSYSEAMGLWIEVKAAGGRPSPEQREFADLAAQSEVTVITGGTNEVIAFLIAGGWLKADQVAHYRLPAQLQEGK